MKEDKKELGHCWVVMSKSNEMIWDWFHTKKQAEGWLLEFLRKKDLDNERKHFKIQKVLMSYN